MPKAKFMRSAVQAIAMSGAFAGTAMAEDVRLTSQDGTIEVTGSLLETDGDRYVIDTAIGPLSVSKSRVVCEGESCLTQEDFQANLRFLAGTGVAGSLLPLALEGFAASQKSKFDIRNTADAGSYGRLIADEGYGDETVKFEIAAAGSADAFSGLADLTADIVFTTRQLTPAEARTFATQDAGNITGSDKEAYIGSETLSAVVHPDNPISEIGMQQLRDILQGKITNWSELGGANAEITLVSKPSDAQPGSMVQRVVFEGEVSSLAKTAIASETDEETSALVSQDLNAIGLVSLSALRGAKPLGLISQCGVNSYPTEFHAKSGDYPLAQPIMMYHSDASDSAYVSEFLDYATGTDFADLVEKVGYISNSILEQDGTMALRDMEISAATAVDQYEEKSFQRFATELSGHDRLSTTFQFRTGSSYLDVGGMKDMEHLAEYLSTQPSGTTVTFVGFSDSVGSSEKNRRLSLKRAKRLEKEVRDMMPVDLASGINFGSQGFGEIRPRACNSSLEGRHLNRRVEVWIKPQTPS